MNAIAAGSRDFCFVVARCRACLHCYSGGGKEKGKIGDLADEARPLLRWEGIFVERKREGQISTQRALAEQGYQALDSLRIDIPKDDVPADFRRVEGVQYIDLQHPSRLNTRPIFQIIEEALREASGS